MVINDLWQELILTLDFQTPLCGGVPRQDDIVRKWVEVRAASEADLRRRKEAGETLRTLPEIVDETILTIEPPPMDVEEEIKKAWVGFQSDSSGLFVRGANLRAHLKDCAQVLAPYYKRKGIGNFKSKLANATYVKEDRLTIMRPDGKFVDAPDGNRDVTMNVMTMQGPRTCLKRVDYVDPARLIATVQLLVVGEINRDHLVTLLEYGKVHGFGQDRSLQFGRYNYTLGE